ncbi:MAG: hypothetical protein QHI48_06280 [Bacteroidota bacterium]|nr:hypothetical protein [Bacteroidota bacterium]
MFFVTYRNVLQPGRTLDEYRRGLAHVWPTLKGWGAVRVEMYQQLYDESGAFFTRYTIRSLDEWNAHVMGPEFSRQMAHLASILDLSQSKVEVGVALETGLSPEGEKNP